MKIVPFKKLNRGSQVIVIMFFVAFALGLITPFVETAYGQEVAKPKAEAHAWFDYFVGGSTPILYPQYGWKVPTKAGTLSGYGFLEQAPQEPLFTNHLVVWTPGKQKFFSVQTEIGGIAAEFHPKPGTTVEQASFLQVGPRMDVPVKGMAYSFVTYLPELQGIRTNNLLIAAAAKPIPLGKRVTLSVEGFRRFFDGADYSEYWFLVQPKGLRRLSLGVHVIQDGELIHVNVGGRISFF